MAYIGRRPDEVFRAQATHDTFTGDGSTVAFDLSFEAQIMTLTYKYL